MSRKSELGRVGSSIVKVNQSHGQDVKARQDVLSRSSRSWSSKVEYDEDQGQVRSSKVSFSHVKLMKVTSKVSVRKVKEAQALSRSRKSGLGQVGSSIVKVNQSHGQDEKARQDRALSRSSRSARSMKIKVK